jgi:hypothetical protein
MKGILANRKAQSTGWAIAYGVITLFAVGLIYIVFNQVFYQYLAPTVKTMVSDPTYNIDNDTKQTVNDNIDRYLMYFNIIPYVIFFAVVTFIFIVAIRKEQQEY